MDESGPQGHIFIEVDDLATHGNAVHGGRTVIQDQSHGFHVQQAKFVQERLSPIVIPRRRRSDKNSETTEGERGNCVQCGARSNGSREKTRPEFVSIGITRHGVSQSQYSARLV